MRFAALPLAGLLLLSSAASAQLTLTPQIGIDNSRTSLKYNDGASFAPLGRQTDPRASLRLDYRLKGGHGPFVGVASSPAPVDFSFADPATGARDFKAGTADRQWRLEGGWQYSSKPLTFRNRKAESAAAQRVRTRAEQQSAEKSRCGSYRYKNDNTQEKVNRAVREVRSKAWNLRLQPFAGAAYIPSLEEDFATTNGTATYKAGNWNTALLAGTGFEFGRGSQRLFTLSVQYLKGLGNLDEKTLVTQSDAKTTTTRLQSDMSAWSVGLGLPFTLAKKKGTTRTHQTKEKSKCGEYKEYRYRCTRKVVI